MERSTTNKSKKNLKVDFRRSWEEVNYQERLVKTMRGSWPRGNSSYKQKGRKTGGSFILFSFTIPLLQHQWPSDEFFSTKITLSWLSLLGQLRWLWSCQELSQRLQWNVLETSIPGLTAVLTLKFGLPSKAWLFCFPNQCFNILWRLQEKTNMTSGERRTAVDTEWFWGVCGKIFVGHTQMPPSPSHSR